MDKSFISPDIIVPDNTKPEDILKAPNTHYTSIVFNSKRFWEMVKSSIELQEGEILLGANITNTTLNIYVKNKPETEINEKMESEITDSN